MTPQYCPLACVQLTGVQAPESGAAPQTFGVPPPPHVSNPVHGPPQFEVPPQPSGMVPQFLPCALHVVGVQPHTFGVPPPPQVLGALQSPQLRKRPQPLGIFPQLAF